MSEFMSGSPPGAVPGLRLVTAVVKPHVVEDLLASMREAGFLGATVSEVKGFGRQGGHTEVYRGAEYNILLLPKVKVEVLCDAETTDSLVDLLVASARTGKIGDGKIWVTPVFHAVRIRTSEYDLEAL